ncbi:MAG TPA: adenylyl-sulfate kinase [Thermodesulfobium narugense]|nr:MAG: adenylyl-sulfate kinase [Thermodesulfobium narugense]HEM55415.1 adenylyl-sulfate kinase [Thermodesulfobium narugense]
MRNFCLLITGLPCSGKTTLGKRLYEGLVQRGISLELFDGDKVRESISKDLDFSRPARIENLVRVVNRARDLMDKGTSCILSMVAPYSEARLRARKIIGEGFVEIYLDVSLETCEKRDVKGMYKRARNGEIKNFTGIDDIYEEPLNPDIRIRTDILGIDESIVKIERFLLENFFIAEAKLKI